VKTFSSVLENVTMIGQRICQPGGFHHQVIHPLFPLQHGVHGIHQAVIDGAADAAIA
jgi:hypothetical protein